MFVRPFNTSLNIGFYIFLVVTRKVHIPTKRRIKNDHKIIVLAFSIKK